MNLVLLAFSAVVFSLQGVFGDFFLPIKFSEDVGCEDLQNIVRIYACLGKGYPKKCAVIHHAGVSWQPGGNVTAVWDEEAPKESSLVVVGLVPRYPKNAWKKLGLHKVPATGWDGSCKIVVDDAEDSDDTRKLKSELFCQS